MRSGLLILGILAAGSVGAEGREPLMVTEDQAVVLARSHSSELRILGLKNRLAAEAAGGIPREYLPKASLSFRQDDRYTVSSPDIRETRWGVTVSQLLFDGGRSGRLRELAKWEASLGGKELAALSRALEAEVRGLVRRIVVQKQTVEAGKALVQVAEKYLSLGRAEFSLGLALETDILEAECRVSGLQIEVLEGEQKYQDSLFRLGTLIGLEPEVPVAVIGEVDPDYPGINLPQDPRWVLRALGEDLRTERMDLERHKGRSSSQQADLWFLPEVTLEAGVSLGGASYPLQKPAWEARLTFRFPWEPLPVAQTVSVESVPGQSWSPGTGLTIGIPFDRFGIPNPDFGPDADQVRKLRTEVRGSFEKVVADHGLLVTKASLQRKNLELSRKKKEILARRANLGDAGWLDSMEAEILWTRDCSALAETVVLVRDTEGELERWLGLPTGQLARWAEGIGAP